MQYRIQCFDFFDFGGESKTQKSHFSMTFRNFPYFIFLKNGLRNPLLNDGLRNLWTKAGFRSTETAVPLLRNRGSGHIPPRFRSIPLMFIDVYNCNRFKNLNGTGVKMTGTGDFYDSGDRNRKNSLSWLCYPGSVEVFKSITVIYI
jgi:hypothetical protein